MPDHPDPRERPATGQSRTSSGRGPFLAAGRWIFLIATLVAVGSGLWLAVAGDWDGALRFALITAAMLAVRWADVPALFAGAFAACVLLATWASVQHWYRSIWQFDVLLHVVTPGAVAAVAVFLLVQARLLPPLRGAVPHLRGWSALVWVSMAGTVAAVPWEFYEWVIEQISPAGMLVGYTDTVIDLFAGMCGSLAVGGLVLWWARRSASSSSAPAD